MIDIKVGQKIYTLNVGNAARGCKKVLTELSLIGIILIMSLLSLMNGDKTPYQVKYEKKCQMMGGIYRSESVYNVATKTRRNSHYCEVNGFEFEDIGA